MRKEELRAALQWAYMMGQKYWAQADSEYPSDWKKADVTRVTFEQFVENTLAALEKSRPWVPLTDEQIRKCFFQEDAPPSSPLYWWEYRDPDYTNIYAWIDKALREKNT